VSDIIREHLFAFIGPMSTKGFCRVIFACILYGCCFKVQENMIAIIYR
jgi:hypothetical protein